MKKLFYPAIFHKAEEGGFWVSFPDFPGCFSQGDDMAQTYEMAIEALGLTLTDLEREKRPFPESTDPTTLVLEDTESFLVLIEFDLLAYKKRTNPRAVKKTLSIPQWLNDDAMAHNINFSQVLQNALKKELYS